MILFLVVQAFNNTFLIPWIFRNRWHNIIDLTRQMNFVVGHIYRIELQTIFLSNLDEAPARRRAREAFKDIQLAIDHCLFRVCT